MLYNMLYMMLWNMIHHVLHNMLRAKNHPSHFPLPCSGSASLQCLFIQQLLVCLALIIAALIRRRGPCHFRAGPIGGSGEAALGGAWRRSGAGFDSCCGPVVLGRILGVPGQHLARNVLHAGFVVDFIQLVHCLPVQEVKPGIDHGILSVPELRKGDTPRKLARSAISILDTHGTSGKAIRQLPTPDASCGAQVLQVRALTHSKDDTAMDFTFCQSLQLENT
jgi:hypothetical protein